MHSVPQMELNHFVIKRVNADRESSANDRLHINITRLASDAGTESSIHENAQVFILFL